MDPNQPLIEPSKTASLGLVVTLVCLAAVGNSLITAIFWNISPEDVVVCCLCGPLVAQPCLLSIWCASLQQRLILRVAISMGILMGLLFLYLITLRSLDPIPLEVPVVFFGVVVVLSLMIQAPLLFLRRFTRQAISLGPGQPATTSDRQFGIKHLLIATTIVALLVMLAQKVFATLGFQGGAPWVEILTFLVSLTVLTALISLLSFGLVFLNQIRVVAGIALLITVSLGSFLVCRILATQPGFSDSTTVFYKTAAYAIGLAAAMNTVLICFYSIGYRMNKLMPGESL